MSVTKHILLRNVFATKKSKKQYVSENKYYYPLPVPILATLIFWLKGTLSRYFRPLVFLVNGTPGYPDSWAKANLNIDSNSWSNLIRFFNIDNAKNFLVDSALCGTAGSRLRAMRHCTESVFVVEFNRRSPQMRIYMQNRFSPWIRGPRITV
jgi:hypothetical protein